MSNVPNFHPQQSPTHIAKLENVFLQANGMAGYQFNIKNKRTKALTQVTFTHQWNHKNKQYEQHVDGDITSFDIFALGKQHEKYCFNTNSNETS